MSRNSKKSNLKSCKDERSHSGLRTGRSNNNKSIDKIKIPKFGKKMSRKDLN